MFKKTRTWEHRTSEVYWAVLWTLLLPSTVGAHNERRVVLALAGGTVRVGWRSWVASHSVQCRVHTACTGAGLPSLHSGTVCHTKEKGGRTRALTRFCWWQANTCTLYGYPSLLTPRVYHPMTFREFRGIFRAFFIKRCIRPCDCHFRIPLY